MGFFILIFIWFLELFSAPEIHLACLLLHCETTSEHATRNISALKSINILRMNKWINFHTDYSGFVDYFLVFALNRKRTVFGVNDRIARSGTQHKPNINPNSAVAVFAAIFESVIGPIERQTSICIASRGVKYMDRINLASKKTNSSVFSLFILVIYVLTRSHLFTFNISRISYRIASIGNSNLNKSCWFKLCL